MRFACDHDLEIARRGEGHKVAGTAVCDDGIVIDLGDAGCVGRSRRGAGDGLLAVS